MFRRNKNQNEEPIPKRLVNELVSQIERAESLERELLTLCDKIVDLYSSLQGYLDSKVNRLKRIAEVIRKEKIEEAKKVIREVKQMSE